MPSAAAAGEQLICYRNDPYSMSASRVLVGLPSAQLRRELSAAATSVFESLVTIPASGASQVPWFAGSASVVRLQCMLREKRPALYNAVVESEFGGTFQKFLSEVTGLALFFYDAPDFAMFPILGHLYNKHEGRCTLRSKAEALPKDLLVAEHWAVHFVPLELTAVAVRVAWEARPVSSPSSASATGSQETSAAEDGGAGTGFIAGPCVRTRHTRQLVDFVVAAAEAELPFATFISKNRLKEAARDAMRRSMPLIASHELSSTSHARGVCSSLSVASQSSASIYPGLCCTPSFSCPSLPTGCAIGGHAPCLLTSLVTPFSG
jgi:hypothetical protein